MTDGLRPTSIGIRAASVDITPEQPCELGGFAGAGRLGARIEGRLEANALLFDDGEHRLFLVSIDTLFIGAEIRDFLEEAAKRAAGGKTVAVLAIASHTHFAPMLDRSKPMLGTVDNHYVAGLKAKLEGLLQQVAGPGASNILVRSYSGDANFSVNRRLRSSHRAWSNRFRTPREVFMAPNAVGYVDPRLRVTMLSDGDDEPLAALAHFACHPTSFPDLRAVTPDYVGGIRAAIREVAGSAIPVVFLQGCAGDVRSAVVGRPTLESRLRRLKGGPHFVRPSMAQWRQWQASMYGFTRSLLGAQAAARPLRGRIAMSRRRLPLTEILAGAHQAAILALERVQIGGEITIVAMSAEPLAKWTSHFPGETLVTGYSGDCFGYLPLEADIPLGGYEVNGHFPAFGLSGCQWREGFEMIVAAAAAGLADGPDSPAI